MDMQGKHSVRKPTLRGRPAALVTAGVASTAVVMIAAHLAVADSARVRAAMRSWSGAALGPPVRSVSPSAPGSLVLTARDRSMCPPAAAACVDLTRHLTWLQSGGKVTFGPVRMEPGPPGSAHATPRGTFSVMWKGGPNVMSNTYNEPMPWAVIFTSSGVAFHAGSLTVPSHGCAHLTMANAHYYNEHLAIGATVVVF
jgi:hypothetical protein